MKTNHLRVSLEFSSGSDRNLESTATTVLKRIYGNPFFPAVPVPAATLEAAISGFVTSRAADDKSFRRMAVVRLLQQLAFYVQSQCQGDPAALRSSGFEPAASGKRTEAA